MSSERANNRKAASARWKANNDGMRRNGAHRWQMSVPSDDTVKAFGKETDAFRAHRRPIPYWRAFWR